MNNKNKLNSFRLSKQTLTLLLIVMSFMTVNAQIDNAEISNRIIGVWHGDFGKKKIKINIEKIQDSIIYGYNSLGENRRNIEGEFEYIEGNIIAKLAEPGDDKYDGLFTITFKQDNTATGTWKMFKGNSFRNFTLNKEQNNEKAYVINTNYKNKTDELIGKWHAYYGRHDYDWYVRIDSISNSKVYGMSREGSLKNNFFITGNSRLENDVYYIQFDEKKEYSTNRKTVKAEFNVKQGIGVYDNLKIEKYSLIKEELLDGLIGNWEGTLKDKKYNTDNIDLKVVKIANDSVFGYTKMPEGGGKYRKMYFGGKIEITNDDWSIYPEIFAKETDDSTFKKYPTNPYLLNFKYLKKKIKGSLIVSNISLDLELKKSKRIKQPAENVKLIDSRLTKLEIEIKNLSELYDETLHNGRLTPYSTIKKAKEQMVYIVDWMKNNPIPSDSNLLTKEQDERMTNIENIMLLYRANTNLQNLLGN